MTVLITGGSAGIGLELAKQFAKDSNELILVSKPEEELASAKKYFKENYQLDVQTIQKDLAQPNAAKELYDQIIASDFKLDILINNAGFGNYGFFNDINLDKDLEMIELNLMTVFKLTRLFVKDMIKRDSGKILNVSSTSSFQPTPMLATYGSTKAFVMNFSRAINFELKEQGSKVRVMALCPPATHTGFQAAANIQDTKIYQGFFCLNADQVAKEAYQALMQGREMIIPSKRISAITNLLQRVLPDAWKMKMVYDNTRKR